MKREQNKILGRIKKCLSLANGTGNPAEATAAIAAAQRLMESHGISIDEVKLHDIQESHSRAYRSANPPSYILHLVKMIAKSFGVEFFYETPAPCKVIFYGPTPREELASYAFDVLSRQLIRDRQTYLKTLNRRLKRSTKTRKADTYAMGWVFSVVKKASSLVPSTEETTLMAIYRQQYDVKETKGRSANLRKQDIGAILSGKNDGCRVDLHRPTNPSSSQQRLLT